MLNLFPVYTTVKKFIASWDAVMEFLGIPYNEEDIIPAGG